LAELRTQPDNFKAQLMLVHGQMASYAESRGEYATIPLEWSLYKWKPFFWSQFFYIVCFVLVAMLWLSPRNRWLYGGTSILMLVPTVWLIGGITVRCIIRNRPPVTTLYETILFITACIVVTALFIE